MERLRAIAHRYWWGVSMLVLIFASGFLGWSVSRESRGPEAPRAEVSLQRFRVAGSSMVPAFYGPSLRISCLGCGHRCLVDAEWLTRSDEPVVCSLCGHRQELSELSPQLSSSVYQGDVVRIVDLNTGDLHGELVAIRGSGNARIKRVVACEGDELSVAGEHLLVNGERIEDRIARTSVSDPPPELLVDDDRLREHSRWSDVSEVQSWRRESRVWICDEGDSPWLLYHHRNVHDHNRPSGVFDDYQYNPASRVSSAKLIGYRCWAKHRVKSRFRFSLRSGLAMRRFWLARYLRRPDDFSSIL